jgi:hypothetical protein
LGTYHAFVYRTMVLNAGLRAAGAAHVTFPALVVAGIVSVVSLWIAVHLWGAVGALAVPLIVRIGLAVIFEFYLVRHAKNAFPPGV